jgi:tellurite resistance-related uncharacterized protein
MTIFIQELYCYRQTDSKERSSLLEQIQMKHTVKFFSRNSKFYKLVIINGDAIHVYLGCNTDAIKQNFVDTALLTIELRGKSTFVIGSKH